MTTPSPTPAIPDPALASDERWALVLRIATGPYLGKAVQLRELLLFLAKKAILSPVEDVTEQEIGWRVLGRRQDYDTQADNIVRVQIRRLRQKLDEYFMGDGWNETLIISIPKGSHVLRFEQRPKRDPVSAPPTPVTKRWRWMIIPAAVGIAAVSFYVGQMSVPREAVQTPAPRAISKSPLWSRVFLNDQPTTVVIADSSLVTVENLLHQDVTLGEYIDGSYRQKVEAVENREIRDALRMISHRQYTSLADATLSSELRAVGGQMGARIAVRYARHMNVRDFNSGNFVLIGSRHSVPWVELFEPGLNFRFERLSKDQFGFRNRKPLKGEPAVYTSVSRPNEPQGSFATISMLPNLSRSGTVLILAGVTMEATEAAGQFAMSDGFTQVLAKTFGAAAEKLPPFEILLRVSSMAGAPQKVDVAAWRKLGL